LRRLPAVAAAVLLAAALAGADEGWVIERLDCRVAIRPDTSIEATEAVDVDFRGLERPGIFRDIISLQSYDDQTNRRYDIRLVGMTDASGRRHQVKQTSEGERAPLFGGRPVAVEFEPPAGIRPGQMGLLFDERADTLDITATIVDSAVRGYLKITELPKTGLLAWFGKPDYQLDRIKEDDAGLLEYERIVLEGLFDSKPQRKLSDLRNSFYNGAVEIFNIRVQSFPGLLVARTFGFQPAEFFAAQELHGS
jgi:hypothetical protein